MVSDKKELERQVSALEIEKTFFYYLREELDFLEMI